MEPEFSLPCSQQPAVCPCPVPDFTILCPPILSLLRSILILPSPLGLVLPSCLFSLDFPTTILRDFLLFLIRIISHAHLILLYFISSMLLREKDKSCSPSLYSSLFTFFHLTLILLTWTKWRAPTNASKWRIGFNSTFKGLITFVHP